MTVGKILITRPSPDADILAREIQAMGGAVFLRPLFNIKRLAPKSSLKGWTEDAAALLFTSAHGVRALAALDYGGLALAKKPVFAVGEASAEAARRAGASLVHYPKEGDAAALLSLILSKGRSFSAKPLLHIAGVHRAGDIGASLTEKGFPFRRAVLYEARPVLTLGRALEEEFRRGGICAALFFSRRAASLFADLARAAEKLPESLRRAEALCMSDRVAEPIASLSWRALHVAPAPSGAAMLKILRVMLEREGRAKSGGKRRQPDGRD